MIEQLVDQVSSYASDIDGVIILVGWFCLVWFVLAEVVFFGFCFFFRRKEGKKAGRTRERRRNGTAASRIRIGF